MYEDLQWIYIKFIMRMNGALVKYSLCFLISTSVFYFISCKKNRDDNVISLGLNITITDQTGRKMEGATVEIYSSAEDRDHGRNIIISKKTDAKGIVRFTGNEFNKNNQTFEKINGVYYLNVFKHNMRQQAETEFLDFTKDKKTDQSIYLENANAETITVKVAVVYENPVLLPQNKRLHELFITPGYSFKWNDPVELSQNYEKTLEEVSGYTIDYQIVKEIDAGQLFTYLKNDPEKRLLSVDEVAKYLGEENWETFKEIGTSYDYNAMVAHYGFDKMRDKGEIHEVWVWTFPYGGMWESHMMGKDAFWINSPPNENPTCTELLSIMGLNYERDLACALESYGHRFESTMMQVYGWWNYDNKTSLSQLSTWEKYSAYGLRYDKFEKGKAQIGNVHFPPNGQQDYDFGNETYILSYVDDWLNYPYLRGNEARSVNRTEWGNPQGSWQLGWMKYYLSHMPRYKGINPNDGKLNNWWHYVVDYNNAIKKQTLD
ncbi:hypothetical protein D7D25_04385 [Proteiniphilum sp. X52]|nr:hypothetical protein D7D25_04385 [Proteiniphilum sp. X52]